MTTTKNPPGVEDGHEVVKWYTRARRFPQLIGKTPDGATIWGGPYTYTQVIAGVAFIVVGSKTTWLWGHFGLIGNALIVLGGAYGLVILLGRLPIGSRNPMTVAAGALRALSSPAQGHLGGSPVRIRRPRTAKSRLVITHDVPILDKVSHQGAERRRRRGAAGSSRLRWSRPALVHQPRPTTAQPRLRPTPAAAPRTAPTPALTGVQRLLASAGAPQEN